MSRRLGVSSPTWWWLYLCYLIGYMMRSYEPAEQRPIWWWVVCILTGIAIVVIADHIDNRKVNE